MPDTPLATHPYSSFSVLASAGTGKTWQLVARVIRLLLHGAKLDSIVAITFTRKAAGEMQLRLNERLQELLEAEESKLDAVLTAIGETPTDSVRERARNLFEQWLRSESSLRTTTFHSFCRELLQRFPLEAGVPPDFELAEETALLIEESWDALFAEATAAPDQPLADNLELLFEELNGLHNTRSALFGFLEHRSDWWAFTHHSTVAVQSATQHLETRLGLDADERPGHSFWNPIARSKLAEFADLLERHPTKTNRAHAAAIKSLLSREQGAQAMVDELQAVFLTASGERRKRTASKPQRKSLGQAGEKAFLQLHEWFCGQIEGIIEAQRRQRTLRVNAAWYTAGLRMLEQYQRIKRERRLLDFADLEWHAHLLLRHPEHAHWIQFKLDQRIDHLLIDEFQDTNPTQWQLIVPLLEEMAASQERWRSLFIVGDAKQSIYRFRRGNPQLLNCAVGWMEKHLEANQIHLDTSRRSSPAILEVVNRVFAHPTMHELLPGFQEHSTYESSAWGRVEIWPLVETEHNACAAQATRLRNPLQQPRHVGLDRRHYREGQDIAQRIQELVQRGCRYGEIIILLRSRTHLDDYERALRDAGVPYLSLDRGTLLQNLEIRDLEALLTVLMTPQDNLSLAQVLRSPIFAAGDDDLMLLASEGSGSWIERLAGVASRLDTGHVLARANRLLTAWRDLTGRIPIHDLLERIFNQSNLLNRYRAAFPDADTVRVEANLTRFVELALEVDAGRYPTLPRFLARVRRLRALDREGPSQAPPSVESGERVRLLTIHAAKGLEAPIVFLADSTNEGSTASGWRTLVRWPAGSDRPTDFMLLGNTHERDTVSARLYELEQQEERVESANLLYVALTRAKHMLVVSGCTQGAHNASSGWYRQVVHCVCGGDRVTQRWVQRFGSPPSSAEQPARPQPSLPGPEIDPRLRAPIHSERRWREIAPSRAVEDEQMDAGDALGTVRGIAIHRMLQLATDGAPNGRSADAILRQVAAEIRWSHFSALLGEWWHEASAVLAKRELQWLFRPAAQACAHNEVPIQYLDGPQTVFGVIDRLVVLDGMVCIVDYKTHRIRDASRLQRLAGHFQAQLTLYREGVRRMWPDHRIVTHLLFTHLGRLVEVS